MNLISLFLGIILIVFGIFLTLKRGIIKKRYEKEISAPKSELSRLATLQTGRVVTVFYVMGIVLIIIGLFYL